MSPGSRTRDTHVPLQASASKSPSHRRHPSWTSYCRTCATTNKRLRLLEHAPSWMPYGRCAPTWPQRMWIPSPLPSYPCTTHAGLLPGCRTVAAPPPGPNECGSPLLCLPILVPPTQASFLDAVRSLRPHLAPTNVDPLSSAFLSLYHPRRPPSWMPYAPCAPTWP